MRRLVVLGLILSICLSFVLATPLLVMADRVSPPSPGCQAANVQPPTQVSSYTLGPDYFYDDDTVRLASTSTVNIHYWSDWGLNKTLLNVSGLSLNIPRTGDYTFVVTAPTRGGQFHLSTICASTPISGGCLVMNNAYVAPSGQTQPYDAGERLSITADRPVNELIVGPGLFGHVYTFNNVTQNGFTFPVDGQFSFHIVNSDPNAPPAQGTYSCTLPR